MSDGNVSPQIRDNLSIYCPVDDQLYDGHVHNIVNEESVLK